MALVKPLQVDISIFWIYCICKGNIQKAKMTFKTIKKALVLYTHMQRRHSKAKMTFKMQREHLNPFLKSILYKIFSLVTHEKYQQQQQ